MEHGDVPGGDQPSRVEVTPPLVPLESDAVIGEAPETPGVSISAPMAEEAVALAAAMVGDNGGDDGGVVGDDRVQWRLGLRKKLWADRRTEKEDAQYAQLLRFWTEPPVGRVQEEQMARCFLLYMLGASLFPNRHNQLWMYEVLDMNHPETTCLDDVILPRALRWSKEYRGVKKGKGNLNAYYLFLDELRPDQVYWRIWDWFEIPYIARSREVTRGRVLLESPYDWQWYLGDRMSCQSLRLDAFSVTGPLPPLVQRTSQYTLKEIERFTQPDPQLNPLF
ncbi:hypothetical protein RHMOL_Rhmol01G0171700 [Rhododendron molle]|uniref:Uncharacterized protein n=1 Tax=Rhododendron molle TaxID=49168 RepID=A0ACC0Q2A2_RHOML|nr:hypothetical protein RHMOL_Rhmol01G0171700 [Rhododendron molle]